jgi:hypothetical protein
VALANSDENEATGGLLAAEGLDGPTRNELGFSPIAGITGDTISPFGNSKIARCKPNIPD